MFSSAAVDCNPSSTEGHVRTTLTTRRDFCRTIQHAIPLATASCERGAQGRRPHPHAPMVSRKPQIRFVAHAAGAVGRHECCWSRVRHECCWSRGAARMLLEPCATRRLLEPGRQGCPAAGPWQRVPRRQPPSKKSPLATSEFGTCTISVATAVWTRATARGGKHGLGSVWPTFRQRDFPACAQCWRAYCTLHAVELQSSMRCITAQ